MDKPELMPVIFVGHGSPMNAIEDNQFSKGWKEISQSIPEPKAILCISAHWQTRGSLVTAMEKSRTIHDFGGFPSDLYSVEYPAPGSPWLAIKVQHTVSKVPIGLDEKWGLDHGTWSVLRRMYPAAYVPVVQLSLDYYQTAQSQYDLAKELAPLREEGILIVGSGNMVHNLRKVVLPWNSPADFNKPFGFDWAIEANNLFKKLIYERNHQALVDYRGLGEAALQAIPTAEHYLPMLYILALQRENETVTYYNDQLVGGSVTMTSFVIK